MSKPIEFSPTYRFIPSQEGKSNPKVKRIDESKPFIQKLKKILTGGLLLISLMAILTLAFHIKLPLHTHYLVAHEQILKIAFSVIGAANLFRRCVKYRKRDANKFFKDKFNVKNVDFANTFTEITGMNFLIRKIMFFENVIPPILYSTVANKDLQIFLA